MMLHDGSRCSKCYRMSQDVKFKRVLLIIQQYELVRLYPHEMMPVHSLHLVMYYVCIVFVTDSNCSQTDGEGGEEDAENKEKEEEEVNEEEKKMKEDG